MTIFQAFILGIVEGLTEFLPVSSTFHLIYTSQLLQLDNNEFLKMFEVFIQSGAILAVLFLYGKELLTDWSLLKKLIVSFIPTAIVGLILHELIKKVFFETNWLMLGAFMLVGVIFIVYENYLRKHPNANKNIDKLSWPQVLLIGLSQALAVIPGVSRSGAVMLTMMMMNQNRAQAAKYSFLLALPTICSAAALDLWKLRETTILSTSELGLLIVGFVTAFLVALVVLKWFIGFLQQNTLVKFGIYRLVAGPLLWLLLK